MSNNNFRHKFLPEGEYTISASSFADGKLAQHVEEEVNIGNDDQRMDLILEPVDDFGWIAYPISLIVGILILLGIVIEGFLYKRWQKKEMKDYQKRHESKELDGDAKNVLKAIDSFEGRVTQKELKQTLNYSDAKLSLILTELEQTGKIRKFKRGRGNIIRKN